MAGGRYGKRAEVHHSKQECSSWQQQQQRDQSSMQEGQHSAERADELLRALMKGREGSEVGKATLPVHLAEY